MELTPKNIFTIPISKIPNLTIEKKILLKKNELENQKTRFYYSQIPTNPYETIPKNTT
jgi:hypothetical protein